MTPDIGLGNWLYQRTSRTPHREALTFEGTTWTYAALQDRIDRLASGLRANGVCHGDRVGFLGFNQPAFLETLFAAARLGAIFVPLNFRLSGAELAYIIGDAGVHTLIADAPHRPVIDTIRGELPCRRFISADQTVDGKADSMAPGAFVGNFHQLQELKKRYPNIKIVMSIGGGGANPLDFSTVSDAAHRKAFVKSCVDMYIKGNFSPGFSEPGIFDGFDIDWEYPASESDEAGLTALLAEFRSQMDAIRPGMTLSIASSAGSWAFQYIDFKAVQKSLDFFGLMEYDFDGPWNDATGLVAPLYQAKGDPDPTNNAAWAVEQYLAAGVKPEKIVFGLPFYGYEWTDVPSTDHGLFQAGTPVGDGASYNAIVPLESSFTKYRDPKTQAPWLYDGTSFWTYDDPTSLAFKMRYAHNQKLGGLMVWDLSGDMPDGQLLKTSAGSLIAPF